MSTNSQMTKEELKHFLEPLMQSGIFKKRAQILLSLHNYISIETVLRAFQSYLEIDSFDAFSTFKSDLDWAISDKPIKITLMLDDLICTAESHKKSKRSRIVENFWMGFNDNFEIGLIAGLLCIVCFGGVALVVGEIGSDNDKMLDAKSASVDIDYPKGRYQSGDFIQLTPLDKEGRLHSDSNTAPLQYRLDVKSQTAITAIVEVRYKKNSKPQERIKLELKPQTDDSSMGNQVEQKFDDELESIRLIEMK
ncbi:MAG: hypothetical protein ACRCXZ_09700 [Patescibacteria group bacterium]